MKQRLLNKNMMPKTSPQVSGAIRARLAYLHTRKAALDELIHCMERYELYASPGRKRARPRRTKRAQLDGMGKSSLRRLSGAA